MLLIKEWIFLSISVCSTHARKHRNTHMIWNVTQSFSFTTVKVFYHSIQWWSCAFSQRKTSLTALVNKKSDLIRGESQISARSCHGRRATFSWLRAKRKQQQQAELRPNIDVRVKIIVMATEDAAACCPLDHHWMQPFIYFCYFLFSLSLMTHMDSIEVQSTFLVIYLSIYLLLSFAFLTKQIFF